MCSRCTDCCTLCAARGISCRHARCADHCTLQSASCICYRDAFLELAGYHISIFPFQRAFHPFCTPFHSTYSSNREPLAFADTSLHADGTHAMLVHTSGGICEPIVKAGGVPTMFIRACCKSVQLDIQTVGTSGRCSSRWHLCFVRPRSTVRDRWYVVSSVCST